jgi:hypothetical protein
MFFVAAGVHDRCVPRADVVGIAGFEHLLPTR